MIQRKLQMRMIKKSVSPKERQKVIDNLRSIIIVS